MPVIFIMGLLERVGVPERLRKLLAIAACALAVIAIVALIAHAVTGHIARGRVEAVAIDRQAATVNTQARVITADRTVAADATNRAATAATQDKELHDAIVAAPAAAGPVNAPATHAALAELRRQQLDAAARRRAAGP